MSLDILTDSAGKKLTVACSSLFKKADLLLLLNDDIFVCKFYTAVKTCFNKKVTMVIKNSGKSSVIFMIVVCQRDRQRCQQYSSQITIVTERFVSKQFFYIGFSYCLQIKIC